MPANKGWTEDLYDIGRSDADTLIRKNAEYGNSWANRGGQGAFFVTARKWDRIENQVKSLGYDIFKALKEDRRNDGLIDDIRDLRAYLMLIEAEMKSWGVTVPPPPVTHPLMGTASEARVGPYRGRPAVDHPSPYGYDRDADE